MCTASVCKCGKCGTHGIGSVEGALKRAVQRDEEAKQRALEWAAGRPPSKRQNGEG